MQRENIDYHKETKVTACMLSGITVDENVAGISTIELDDSQTDFETQKQIEFRTPEQQIEDQAAFENA
jgi:hypothetical protein